MLLAVLAAIRLLAVVRQRADAAQQLTGALIARAEAERSLADRRERRRKEVADVATPLPAEERRAFLLALLESSAFAESVEDYCRHADARGDPIATYVLGVLLELRGNLPEAEMAFRIADQRGDAPAARRMAEFLAARGEANLARAAVQRAETREQAAGLLGRPAYRRPGP